MMPIPVAQMLQVPFPTKGSGLSMSGFSSRLSEGLAERKRQGLYRQRPILESSQGPVVQVDGARYLNFCSNDYLGLAADPRVVASFQQAAAHYGVGSGASHLVCGHSTPHRVLEEAVAEFTGRDRALMFASGYAANTAVLKTLLQRGDYVFQDKLNHASLLDGGLQSGARFQRFLHNDVASLASKLETSEGNRLVVVDGVFSMDGDQAPLPALAQVCERNNAWLMVDDAHGFGVLGDTGAGSLEVAGLGQKQVPVLMVTLGKALGVAGACVIGDDTLIESLIQQARNYIYTTATPPAVAAAAVTALRLVRDEPERRQHLRDLISRFRQGTDQLGLPVMESATAIQPLLVGEAQVAMQLSDALLRRGVLVGAIRPPTVAAGTSRLRVTLSAAHSAAQVDELLDNLAACWSEVRGANCR
jgi:8-amino-7-oxononanoate synthase